MTTDGKAKFRYSAHEGVIELEGTEEFISTHMETLTDLVRVISRHTPVEAKIEKPRPDAAADGGDADSKPGDPNPDNGGIENYARVYSQINEKLKIICKIPGSNKSEKSKNAALLYCYGSELMGDEQVPSTEIRGVCEEHGFLDSANFSKIFDDKTTFLVDGKKGGSKQVKLTFTGREKAVELLKGLGE